MPTHTLSTPVRYATKLQAERACGGALVNIGARVVAAEPRGFAIEIHTDRPAAALKFLTRQFPRTPPDQAWTVTENVGV